MSELIEGFGPFRDRVELRPLLVRRGVVSRLGFRIPSLGPSGHVVR